MNTTELANRAAADLSTTDKVRHIGYVVATIDQDDRSTEDLLAGDIKSGHYLIGESGGIALVVEDAKASNSILGLTVVLTEVGPVYLDPEETYRVLVD